MPRYPHTVATGIPQTREDACELNHLAQLIAGSGALEIVYNGIRPDNVERLAREAVAAAHEKT